MRTIALSFALLALVFLGCNKLPDRPAKSTTAAAPGGGAEEPAKKPAEGTGATPAEPKEPTEPAEPEGCGCGEPEEKKPAEEMPEEPKPEEEMPEEKPVEQPEQPEKPEKPDEEMPEGEPEGCGCGETPEGCGCGEAEATATAVPNADEAIQKGVAYLRSQAKNGMFLVKFEGRLFADPAFTAMAATAIARSLPADKRKQDPLVKSAVAFILRSVQDSGSIHTGGISKYDNYYTSAAIMLLTTVDPVRHKAVIDKMAKYILSIQRKDDDRLKGGFGYNTAKGADLSNAQYAIEALRAAGIPEDAPEMKAALQFLERVQNRSENEANKGQVYPMDDKSHGKIKVVPGNDGSAGYEPGVSKAGLRKLPDGTFVPRGYGSMTYALLKCYLLAGLKPDDARVQATAKWLAENYTWDKNPGFEEAAKTQEEAPSWGLFYYYMTAAKALRLMGVDKLGDHDWRKDLVEAIVKRQQADGSWINKGAARWNEDRPVLVTSYALLALAEATAK